MPNPTLSVPLFAKDPGFLFHAPLGTAEPANTVAGSVFTDAWPAAWALLGATEEGHNFSWQTSFEPITFAELADPAAYVETGREGSFAFALGAITLNNLKRALNGGSIVTTGTGATTLSKYTPPALGASVRCLIGWESQDSTERLIGYQCINTGQVQIARRRGAAKATIPVEYALEAPSGGGSPWAHYAAGTARLGV